MNVALQPAKRSQPRAPGAWMESPGIVAFKTLVMAGATFLYLLPIATPS